jgi:hypothetical protein
MDENHLWGNPPEMVPGFSHSVPLVSEYTLSCSLYHITEGTFHLSPKADCNWLYGCIVNVIMHTGVMNEAKYGHPTQDYRNRGARIPNSTKMPCSAPSIFARDGQPLFSLLQQSLAWRHLPSRLWHSITQYNIVHRSPLSLHRSFFF